MISAATGFTQTSNCPGSLLAFLALPQTCVIDVSFVPSAVGQITGLLSTGSGGPTVALSGAGSAPQGASGVKRRKCKKKHRRSAEVAKKKKCKKRR